MWNGTCRVIRFVTGARGEIRVESVQLLKQIFIFRSLSSLQMIQVNKIVHSRHVVAGETIIREGDAPDFMYVVKEGEVEVCRHLEDGSPEILAILGPGDHFGEIALIDHGPRSADVVACDDGELLTLHQNDFQHLMKSDTSIKLSVYEAFLDTLCARLRAANDSVMVSQRITAN